jgi:integrase/recombinase XerD
MNGLRRHLAEYLELRRGLGFDLGRCESRLRNLIAYMERKRTGHITIPLVLDFILSPRGRSANTQYGYLSAIRGFARYLSGIDAKTEIPPAGLVRRDPRPEPYIYSEMEVRRLLEAVRMTPAIGRYALKPWTLHCLIGLLAVTGMRAGEAIALKPEDIDWEKGILTVGRAKYQKSRLIPLHRSTVRQLRAYARRRDQFFAECGQRPRVNRFFVTTYGGAFTSSEIGHDFRRVTRRLGLRKADARRGPRVHDLRHRFAVSTLLRWYRENRRIDPLLPVLSTYLGHVFITGTYWYLTCTPELMEAAGARLENRWKGGRHA